MEAPIYRPASIWEAPIEIPRPLNTRDSSLAEFLATPVAKRIMVSEIPDFLEKIGVPSLAMHLSNLGPRNLVLFGILGSDALDRVDAKLEAYYATHRDDR